MHQRNVIVKTNHRKPLFRLLIFVLLLSSLLLQVTLVRAEGAIDYDITLTPTAVSTGELITYEFSSSCSGVVGGCSSFSIEIDFDETIFEYVGSVIDSADNDATVTPGAGSFTINDPNYGDGDGFTATVTLRVRQDLTTGAINIPSIVTTTSGDPDNTINGTTTLPTIDVEDPDLRYDVRKTQVLPNGLNPAANDGVNGAYVQYNVQYCASQSTDVLPITDAVLVDQLPPGVNLLTPPTDPPDATSGTVATGQFLIWDVGDLNGSSGCISRTVAYEFPEGAGYDENSDGASSPSTSNNVFGYYNDDTSGLGTCVTNCVGTFTESPELDPATGEPNVSKSVRDDRPVAHPGNNEFSFGMNTNQLNVDMTNITLGDTIPLVGGQPGADVYQVFSGTWDNALPATLRVIFQNGNTDEFAVDGTGLTVTYGDATTGGSASVTPTSSAPAAGVRDLSAPNRISRVELVFPTVPQAFSMGSARLLFTVNTDVVAGDEPITNCAVASYSSPPNPTPAGTVQGCANTTLTNDTSSVVNWNKGASPNSVDNTDATPDFIDFTLTLQVDQQSSNSLTGDLSYTDDLPEVLDYVAQDNSPFIPNDGDTPYTISTTNMNAGAGDDVPNPYFRIISGTTDTIEFIWTTDPTTLTYPIYDITGVEFASSAGVTPNPVNVTPPATGSKDIILSYRARVKDVTEDAFAGTYTNNATVDAGTISLYCDGATSETDTCNTATNFTLLSVNSFEASKWVRSNVLPVVNVRADRTSYNHNSPQFTVNPNFFCTTPIGTDEVLRDDTEALPIDPINDPAITDNNNPGDGVLYSRTPCVAQGNPGESFEYIIEITNRGNNELDEFIFYDILPYIGDTGVNQAVATTPRYTEFEVWLDGDVTIDTTGTSALSASDFDIQYSTSTNPCRPEMSSGNSITDWQGCGTFVEDSASSSGTRNPRSFRITQIVNDGTSVLSPDESLIVRIPVYIPTESDLVGAGLTAAAAEDERAETGEIAWNSFAFRFRSDSTGDLLLAASPRKVGIRIPERLSVGNRVWLDTGGGSGVLSDIDDRERDDVSSTEAGIANVVLELYRYEGAGSLPSNTAGTDPSALADTVLVARTVTDAEGYYLFETDMRSTSAADGAVTVNGITFPAVPNDTDSPDTDNYPDDAAYDWIGGADTRSLRPGSYFIYIPPINFSDDYNGNTIVRENATDVGPLLGLGSSTGVDTTSGRNSALDNMDRGIDSGIGADIDPPNNGVISDWFDLQFYTSASLGGEPAGSNNNPLNEDDVDVPNGETPPSGTGPYGRGTFFQKNEFSDLVRDFGFVNLMSIGNFVWHDNGDTATGTDLTQFNDGIFNGTEVGIADVTVNLYRDVGGTLTFIDSTTTSNTPGNEGYYIFDNIPQGTYVIEIPTSEFTGTGPLVGYASSFDGATAPVDSNDIGGGIGNDDLSDHGIDVTNPISSPIRSAPIVLLQETETQDDSEDVTDTNDNTLPYIEDVDSDLTVDFGFVRLMSIGNRVWYDTGETATTYNPTFADNGTIDPGEIGVNGVTVNLYRDFGGVMTFISSTTTFGPAGSEGYYIFDNLPEGTYQVEIPISEFSLGADNTLGTGDDAVLAGYYSSTDVSAPVDGDPDNDDHGTDVADPTLNPILSPLIVLTANSEPSPTTLPDDSEDVTNTNANTPPVITDANSDLTVDFGFIRPMGLGNRVWFDTQRSAGVSIGDGIRQASEQGINNVELQLYADNGDGVFNASTDTLISVTTTAGPTGEEGYYLFDRLSEFSNQRLGPGDYFVNISSTQFQTSATLDGFVNSNANNTTAAGTDNLTDSSTDGGDENGVNPTPGVASTYPINAGVHSTLIQLRYTEEPTTQETDFLTSAPNDNGENVTDNNGDMTIDFGFYQGIAIGNRVWYDSNRDGIDDGTDSNPISGALNAGIAGVTVELFRADALGQPTGTAINTDVTDQNGYYLFDRDSLGELLIPGDYVVGIRQDDPVLLANNVVSTITRAVSDVPLTTGLDADVDNDDNGIDRRDVDPDPTTYWYSEAITLSHFDETEAEADTDKEDGVDGDPWFGDGQGIPDNNSNLTVDFGFFTPLALGNRVWFDSNNNALIDAGEEGIDDVIVELFRDTGAGFDLTGDPYRVTLTEQDPVSLELGYYLFDDLPDGNYIVRLSPANFQAASLGQVTILGQTFDRGALTDMFDAPYSSSESGGVTEAGYLNDNQTESNDNGIDANFPQVDGIVSTTINLSLDVEPDGIPGTEDNDDDLNSAVSTDGGPEGTFGEQDNDADLTIDFGVYTPLMSIGNFVFKDYDNDRIFNNVDEGVDGVIVNLFFDANSDGLPDSGITNPIQTTTTANGGFYLFDGLSPGNYLVQVDEVNFRTTGNQTLRDFYSSQDKDATNNPVPPTDNENDLIESGIDNPFSLANNPDPQANGVFSPTIVLEPSGEATDEDTIGGYDPTLPNGDGEPNIQPSNSDLTIDFGFYQPMSIGNVVWFDTDADSLFDTNEAGIPNVQVYLHRDDGDGIFDPALDPIVPVFNGSTYVNFDTTDDEGYYLFDNLLAGEYFVNISSTNFIGAGALFGHNSTTPEGTASNTPPAPTSDSNDNGTPNADGATFGVTSELITLGVPSTVDPSVLIPGSAEPTQEFDKSLNPPSPASEYDGPASIGRYGEIDANSDITIDFGFVLESSSSMSIGNRVWFDGNHNGLVEVATDDPNNPGDPGIDDVVVLLYRSDTAGNPIGSAIARDITRSDSGGNSGYYLFDVLDTDATTAVGEGDGLGGPVGPGNYVVVIPNSNFTSGGALENHRTTYRGIDNTNDDPTTDSTTPNTFVDITDDDNNDNGRRVVTRGIVSDRITLVLNSERSDEGLGEPVGLKDVDDLDGTDASSTAIAVNNSDLTIDFGFYIPMSLGNFVWVDTNNDGIYDPATEVPVDDGVTLTLYVDDGTPGFQGTETAVNDPSVSPTIPTPYQVTTTDGYYLFENLPPNDNYIVVIDASNFATGTGILEGYLGSDASGTFEDDTDDDDNDNGRDVDPTILGIPSGVISLSYGSEPESETTSGNSADGPNGRGNNGELDNNSNLTVDFGVYPSTYFSIGNRVWQDNGAGGNRNNGIMDSDESGINNVRMYLFRDDDLDGTPDTTTPYATTNTDSDGYYLFDSLPTGSYIVTVAPENFNTGGVLRGFGPSSVSTPNADDDTDNTSDHTNTAPVTNFGILSNTYTLEIAEPISPTEFDPTPDNAVQDPGTDPAGNAIPDNQSNLTVDFGFVRTMTVGNLVWYDLDQNGRYNAGTEVGISDVLVQLWEDTDDSGDFDDTIDQLVDSDITDGNGFYLFNNVSATNFFVHIPYINWDSTNGALFLYESTTDANAGDRGDNNDNGIGTGDTDPVDGITSERFTMAFNSAPTGESTLSNNDDDGPEYRGVNNPTDNNSDLTRDFGFFLGTPMSIGNIVWIDDGGPTGGGTAGNGERDGDEEGVDGVVVELYRDSDNDGDPDTTTPLATTTTDDGGYYLFDGLPPGDYIVVIAEENFDNGGVLNGYRSTDPETPGDDDHDNGDNGNDPTDGGVKSGTIILTLGNQPSPGNLPDDSEDVTGTGDNGELDENSNLTVDFGFLQAFDWGDAPDTYGTDNSILTTISPTTDDSDEVGPSHRIVANLYLGDGVDDENDGQPVPPPDPVSGTKTSNNTSDPVGDGTDEDGMDFPNFVAGTTVTVDVTAYNQTGEDATLIGWFDWDGNGVFDPDEAYTVNVPDGTDGIVQLEVDIPIDAQDETGGSTYVRLRLTNDSISASEPTGPKNSGEVEDYLIEVSDPGLLINKTDGINSIIAGETNTYTITIENSGEERIGVRFYDEMQIATDGNPNGYDPETIEWTCEATNGASCISNSVSGTSSSGGPYDADATEVIIDELIDIPRDGVITYTITARVNPSAGLDGSNTPLINVAQLPNEDPVIEDDDITAVIYDPPFGVKTGTLLNDTIIRWTMIWYNPGAEQDDVVISDTLGTGQTFPATLDEIDLQCSGSVGSCSIQGDDTVVWEGTMLTSTEDDDDDAVIIAFNVLIEGDGTYRNTATLEFPTDVTVSASARVRVEDGNLDNVDDEDEDSTEGGSEFTQPPPSLSKVVDTPFTLPGATVVWTITSSNDTGNTIKNLSITDTVPDTLSIVSADSSAGNLTVDGQTVLLKMDNLFEGESVTITVTTVVSPDVEIPFAINNPAILRCNCSEERNSVATILSVFELPATGETPWWRYALAITLVGGIAVTTAYIGFRRKTQTR